jgi:ATP-dependent exoDNAse (exonuclease V) beta subunit
VTDLAAHARIGGAVTVEGPLLDEELVVGRAVHRLLARGDAIASDGILRARVLADLDADERLVIADAESFASGVIDLARGVWSDAPLRRALASPEARFEVPIVFRHGDAEDVRLVRGTIDCVVAIDDRVLVLEFKTGRAQPSHGRQLALYVDAVSAMLPAARVEGQLVYASRPQPAMASAPVAARLPFDE